MPKLSIIQRVLLGFSILLLTIVVLGVTAVNRLGQVSEKLTESYEQLIPLLLNAQEVPGEVSQLADLTSKYLLQSDVEQRQAIADQKAQEYEQVRQQLQSLEQEMHQVLGSNATDFSQVNQNIDALQGTAEELMQLSDDLAMMTESVALTRMTFYRLWRDLSVDMLRLQDNADRATGRRIRAFERAGQPVTQLFDDLINAPDREELQRVRRILLSTVETMDGYIEQVSEDDPRTATVLTSYRDRVENYVNGQASLFNMIEQRMTLTEALATTQSRFSALATSVANDLTQASQSVQRYANVQQRQAAQSVNGANMMMLLAALAAALIAFLIGWGIVRSIKASMKSTMAALESVAAGNFITQVDTSRQDEFAKLGAIVNQLVRRLSASIKHVAEVARQLDESATESLHLADETQRDTGAQKLQADSIATAINELESTVGNIANASSDARTLVQTVSDRATAGSQSMASNTQTIDELANQIEQANGVIHELSDRSQRITSVLDVISDIAEQTNLLALNAAIEAARAGESGRGFAVVADEVRSLADKTRSSTVEIKSMIDRLVDASNQVSDIMAIAGDKMQVCVSQSNTTGKAIDEITEAVRQVDSMSEQIAAAAAQQTSAVQEISHNVVQVAELADRSAGRAAQGVKGSQLVDKLAAEQSELVAQFTYQ